MVNKTRNKEKFINKILKGCFYSFINLISDTKFVKGASDFRMFKEHVTKAIVSLNENNRFSKGIFSWVGFNTHYLEYKVENRNSGKSNFNVTNQFKYAFNGIINFSVKPLRIATYIGFYIFYWFFHLFNNYFNSNLIMGIDVPGYPSLICAILFLGGMQLIAIGILGEYVSKTYLETKRPVILLKTNWALMTMISYN